MIKKNNLPTIDLNHHTLTDKDERIHQLYPKEFWYMAPKGTQDKVNNSYTELPMLLHNAHTNNGIVPAMTDLLKGIKIKTYRKKEEANTVETVFEETRFNYYPRRPSRLCCHFLSLSKEIAENRLKEWKKELKDNYIIVKCYLILSSGIFHFADITKYEEAIYNADVIKEYAHSYWKGFSCASDLDKKIELLADSALYFPDWENFPKIELDNVDLSEENRKINPINVVRIMKIFCKGKNYY